MLSIASLYMIVISVQSEAKVSIMSCNVMTPTDNKKIEVELYTAVLNHLYLDWMSS